MAVGWSQQLSRGPSLKSCPNSTRSRNGKCSSSRKPTLLRSAVLDKDASSSKPSTSSDSTANQDWSCDFYKASHWLTLERLYRMSGKEIDLLESSEYPLNLLLPECFFVTVNDRPPRSSEKTPDYYANVGDAIRTLREDIPLLFNQELNYSIYREDIVFKDPRNSFQGMKNYKLIFWSLRFHGKIFFKKLYVDVKRIWQPEDGIIRMRWTVKGVPRVPWEAEGTFDGISQYKLDNSGKIYEHAVDNVILRDPPLATSPFLAGLNLVPAAPQQQPCPGMWYEDATEQDAPAHSYLARFSWVRFYLALLATVQVLGADNSSSRAMECPSA